MSTSWALLCWCLNNKKGGGYNWYINDGQQRLVTCTLIFAKLAQLLGNSRDASSRKLRANLYSLCFVDLKANDIPDALEQPLPQWKPRIIAPTEDTPDFCKLLRNLDLAGDTKLMRAWKEIGSFLAEPSRDKTAWHKRFANYVLQGVSVVQLNVPESFDLHAIFETLNARGKPLEEIDLLKNYCLHRSAVCGKKEGDAAKEGFELLEKGLKRKKLVTEYVRCHMQSRFGYLPEKNMFRNMRSAISKEYGKKGECSKFAGLLEEVCSDNMRLYDMYRHPNNYVEEINGLVSDHKPGRKRKLIDCLRDLSRYTITFPVLHALFIRFLDGKGDLTDQDLLSATRLLSSFMTRVSLTQNAVRPSLYEKELASLANSISNGEIEIVEKIYETIKKLDQKGSTAEVINNREFVNELSVLSTRSAPKSKFLLAALENSTKEDTVVTLDDCQICHVLPTKESMWPSWPSFGGMHNVYCNKLGNKLLLEKSLHEQVEEVQNDASLSGPKQFSKIKEIVVKSKFKHSRAITEHDKWLIECLESRQRKMAKLAASIWSIK